MSDLISRQDAIKACMKYSGQGYIWSLIMKEIEKLPSATDKNVGTKLGTDLAEVGTDAISRQAVLNEFCHSCDGWSCNPNTCCKTEWIRKLPPAQPERTCVNCGRTINNGGWYADGGTRCPIEEHYALPKDGYCHLWEKRNVTDDDYPEGRADE